MLKPDKSSHKKGRWLVLDQTGQTKEEVLALVKAIDGAEIKIINNRTYVRFPERQAQITRLFPKIARVLLQKRTEFVFAEKKTEIPRQYCAVMLKKKKQHKG